MTDSETIHEQAQRALGSLLSNHPDTGVAQLQGVLARLDPNSSDAEVFVRAIQRLDEIAYEISEVEDLLTEADFSFGKIEA